jgi:hypothetical protein
LPYGQPSFAQRQISWDFGVPSEFPVPLVNAIDRTPFHEPGDFNVATSGSARPYEAGKKPVLWNEQLRKMFFYKRLEWRLR